MDVAKFAALILVGIFIAALCAVLAWARHRSLLRGYEKRIRRAREIYREQVRQAAEGSSTLD
jgi:hypothetical protein